MAYQLIENREIDFARDFGKIGDVLTTKDKAEQLIDNYREMLQERYIAFAKRYTD